MEWKQAGNGMRYDSLVHEGRILAAVIEAVELSNSWRIWWFIRKTNKPMRPRMHRDYRTLSDEVFLDRESARKWAEAEARRELTNERIARAKAELELVKWTGGVDTGTDEDPVGAPEPKVKHKAKK